MPSPTLLLLPGLLCDASVWQHQADHIDGASLNTVEVKLNGDQDRSQRSYIIYEC